MYLLVIQYLDVLHSLIEVLDYPVASLIEHFLKKGRLEIPEGSDFYITCEKCGCHIRYGRYCPECTLKTVTGLKSLFHEDMGERPKSHIHTSNKGKMHFFK